MEIIEKHWEKICRYINGKSTYSLAMKTDALILLLRRIS